LRHCSLLPFPKPLPSFPMCRAFPGSEYYDGSAPPSPFSGRCAYPGQRAGYPPPGTEAGRFPCSLSFARRRRSPAVSQRPRHRYAADLPRGLPAHGSHRHARSSRRLITGGTRRARPRSARFEPVAVLKDVITPVPRVLLSATLTGPAPSGSTGHVPALSGPLPPSPAPPGSGCPQLHPLATTRQAMKVSHLHSNHSASRRKPES
jgi:hypothetical protein